MTDATPRPDDELVSAVLDGEATDDERARVEADPAARRRLAELAAVRDLVAAPVPVPAGARDRAVAAALAQFDLGAADADPGGVDPAAPAIAAPVDELGARRARRDRSGRGGRFLAAAAAVVVAVLGAAAVLRAVNPASETSVASSGQAPTADQAPLEADDSGGVLQSRGAEESAATTTAPDAVGPVPSTTPAPTSPAVVEDQLAGAVTVDLGAVATPRELRDRLLGVLDQQAATDTASGPASTTAPAAGFDRAAFASCASYLAAVDPELGPTLAVGAATFGGRPAVVYAFGIDQVAHPAANGSIRIYAVDPTSCATLSVQTVR